MADCSMYKMKPLYGNDNVVNELPTGMYVMKNIYTDPEEYLNGQDLDVMELVDRQKNILCELEKLKQEIGRITQDIELDEKSIAGSEQSNAPSTTKQIISSDGPCNIVIKTSPDEPPYSVILLYHLVQHHGNNCSLVSHIHSSWCEQAFPEKLLKVFQDTCNQNSSSRWRFIWKRELIAPNLMISISDQSPIMGEENILRYLARRFIPDLYNDNYPLVQTSIDEWLNMAAKRCDKPFLQKLNSHLGKNKWLAGNDLSLADIYCFVAVAKSNVEGNPKNITRWMTECRKYIPAFNQVEKLCK